MLQNTTCGHCGLTETTEHILLHCSFAKQVWSLIPLTSEFNPDMFSSFTLAVADISSSICLAPCGIPGDLFSWVCWNLWIARNKLFFKARLAFVQTTATKTLAGAIEWTHAQDPHVATPKNTLIPVRPQLIPVGTVTCNTDANWKKKTSVAGLAWIFDSSPPLITSDSCQYQNRVSSILMAEGLVVKEALSHAQHIGITKFWLPLDSISLVRAINSVSKPMSLYGVLSDIESLSSFFAFCCIYFILREENEVADNLSQACLFHVVTT